MTGLIVALAWGAGIAAGLAGAGLGWLGPALGLATLAGARLAGAGLARVAALVAAFMLLGLARAELGAGGAPGAELAGLTGEVALVGRVLEAPLVQGGRVSFPLEVLRVERPGPGRELEAGARPPRVLVRGQALEADYGDLVAVYGRLAAPRSRAGYPEAELLARRGIGHVVDWATVRVREKAVPSGFGTLYRLRRTLEGALRAALPEPQASLTAGIVLGTRSGTPPELRSALAASGTSHIVAVSGFNVAVVAGVVQAVALRAFGRPWALLPMLAAVWGYTLFVGAPPSALRAAAMVSLVFGAQAVGRLPDPITTLALASGVLLAWEPQLLLDLGFQLSVAATAGLILFAGRIADRLPLLPRAIREPLAVALAAQLATLPIVLATFHTWPLIAPVANLLIGPVLPWIMLCGALLAILAPLPGLGDLLAWATWGLVSYALAAIEWAAGLPGAVLFTGRLPAWLVVAGYGLLALWAAAGSADVRAVVGHRLPLRAGLLAATLALLPASAVVAGPPSGALAVSFVDAGGPAAFVRAPSGRSVVLDGGATTGPLVASVARRLSIWERGVDLAVATSGGPAEGALAESLRRYPAGLVLGPPTAEPGALVDLGDGAWLEVVDVRVQRERPTLDLQVVAGNLAVWLPAAGPPSPRWRRAAEAGRPAILRLPGRSAAWLREAPDVAWLAVVADGPVSLPEPLAASVPLLDHRTYGDVELVFDGAAPSLRTARCPHGRGCLVELGLHPQSAPP